MENPFQQLYEKQNNLEAMLRELLNRPERVAVHAEVEQPIKIEEAAAYLMLSTSTVYQNLGKIPSHKRNNQLYFFKSELQAYIQSGAANEGKKSPKRKTP